MRMDSNKSMFFRKEVHRSQTFNGNLGFVRYWLYIAHKLIGLLLGSLFVLIGLSGAILVYRDTIDENLNSDLMIVEAVPRKDFLSVDEIYEASKSSMPPGARAERITLPRHQHAAAIVTYILETDDLDTFVYELFIDPYSASVKGKRLKIHGEDQLSQPLIPIIIGFHWTLLLGANNAYVIGIIALFIMTSVIIGLYLWWPANGNWRMGLTIKWSGTRERINFDIHRIVGFYFGALLLISLTTGVAMIFKPVTRNLINRISTIEDNENFGKSSFVDNSKPIKLGEAVNIANHVFPEGRLHWILLPTSSTGVFIVGKQAAWEPNISKTFRNVGIDQYNGAITKIQDQQNYHFGDKAMEWLFPLHSGEFLGETGRSIIVVLGLMPFILFLTGLRRWLSKRSR